MKMEISAAFLVLSFCVLLCSGASDEFTVEGCPQKYENLQSLNIGIPANQPYRSSFHFQPPQNWMNDPNGPMYYKGLYHFFYQYNPKAAAFGDIMIWAHSVSYDLINWIHLNHALCPSQPSDFKSCWSGSATILPGDKPFMLYTGIDANGRQVQNLAIPKNASDPFLREWVKYSGNPVMIPPDGIKVDNFRDPTTAWMGPDGEWRVIVGSHGENQGLAILYKSKDFVHWTKDEHPLYSSEKGGMWECPDFFPVSINSTNGVDTSVHNPSVKHVMKSSHFDDLHDYYTVGNYDLEKDQYFPEGSDLRFDHGKFYASKTFFDSAKNRRIVWAWANESDNAADDIKKGWAGVQTIPRRLWLDASGKQLLQWPVEEVETLRGNQVTIHDQKLKSGSVLEVRDITASQADIEVDFVLPALDEAELIGPRLADPQLLCSTENASISSEYGPFGLLALANEEFTEQTAIFFRIYKGYDDKYVVLMCSDHSRSSIRNDLDKTTYGAFVDVDVSHEKISLRSLIDHSIIESFGGGGKACITTRVYPELATDVKARLYIFNHGRKDVVISNLNAWSMKNAQMINQNNVNYTIDHTIVESYGGPRVAPLSEEVYPKLAID